MPRAKLPARMAGRFDSLRVAKVATEAKQAVAVAQSGFATIDGAIPGGVVANLDAVLQDIETRLTALEP